MSHWLSDCSLWPDSGVEQGLNVSRNACLLIYMPGLQWKSVKTSLTSHSESGAWRTVAMGSVNCRRADKMTCVRPRSWRSNGVCLCHSIPAVYRGGFYKNCQQLANPFSLSHFPSFGLLASTCSSAPCPRRTYGDLMSDYDTLTK